MNSDDQKLREYFAALRAADGARAPSFQRLSRAPSPVRNRENHRFSPRPWIALGAGAAALAAFALSFHGAQTNTDNLSLEEQCLAIASWTPTTDALLASNTGLWESSSATDELIQTESGSAQDPAYEPNDPAL